MGVNAGISLPAKDRSLRYFSAAHPLTKQYLTLGTMQNSKFSNASVCLQIATMDSDVIRSLCKHFPCDLSVLATKLDSRIYGRALHDTR